MVFRRNHSARRVVQLIYIHSKSPKLATKEIGIIIGFNVPWRGKSECEASFCSHLET